MFKFIAAVLITLIFSVSSQAIEDKPYGIWGHVSADFSNIESLNGTAVKAHIGALGALYLTPNIGFFGGLEYAPRGGKILTADVSYTYLDIPFGLTFKMPSYFTEFTSGYSHVSLGLFYALALSGEIAGISGDPESFLGLILDSIMTFPIAESGTSLGIKTGIKYGFGNTSPGITSTKAFDFSIGLAFLY